MAEENYTLRKSSIEADMISFCLEAVDAGLTGQKIIDYMVDEVFPKNLNIPIAQIREQAKTIYDEIANPQTGDL